MPKASSSWGNTKVSPCKADLAKIIQLVIKNTDEHIAITNPTRMVPGTISKLATMSGLNA